MQALLDNKTLSCNNVINFQQYQPFLAFIDTVTML